jgi:hypothetical protein
MKQTLIILLAILLILLAAFFMVRDFFFQKEKDIPNPYEYDLGDFREVDEDLICYTEVRQLNPGLEALWGIAVDEKDRVFVTGASHVIIYDKSGNQVQDFITGKEANCLAVSHGGEIFLGMSDHIEVMDFSGNLLDEWPSLGERSMITSIAVADSSVYVADAGNKVVRKYAISGEYLMELGRRNRTTGDPGFVIPSPYFDLLLGREGELWVVNPGMHALQSYNQRGEQVSSWNRTSMQPDGFSGCCNPSHIAMLSNGSFVTSEKGLERVKIHLPSGDFRCVVAGPEQFEPGTAGLDLAVDSEDRIYVLDPKKKQVRVFERNEKEL